nr:RecName: Full=U7-ctenitoxin-Pn1b; Short=U7-CNTX-Pn1b; AltName: Full=Neurotoxin Tx3 [Phoneutria nigriventer]
GCIGRNESQKKDNVYKFKE